MWVAATSTSARVTTRAMGARARLAYRGRSMCGIVGLYAKTAATSAELGHHAGRMLVEMGDRGPDSAGLAVYREPLVDGSTKLSLHAREGAPDWDALVARLGRETPVLFHRVVGPEHALVAVEAGDVEAQRAVAATLPEVEVAAAGTTVEIIKEAIRPAEFVDRFALDAISGTHALGHTRMATESRVTTAGSHPFSTGGDLCLVHNGSLSNHNRLRLRLRDQGIEFQTENDTEVAAGYVAWRLREGDTLERALERCLDDLDGFYTFAVGTADGFAVLRDPIACKPAVMAETDDWVAMASEYRALAVLPGADDARVWEPEPATVYHWGRAPVAA
jgi:methylamine---glutamate N-methyltransferase subunit A